MTPDSLAATSATTSPVARTVADAATLGRLLKRSTERHAKRARTSERARADRRRADTERLSASVASHLADGPLGLMLAFQGWAIDTAQRQILFLDALRKRGDDFHAHAAAGAPPVLVYDYELMLDGATLPRPCNYTLLRILAPEGIEIDDTRRPFIIIDPRAGHGAGIGGFKEDSQVGVALASGQPVYFVAFRPMPEPGQTIADVTEAEAAFLRLVSERHPDSPKPVLIGNCQGGWAAALLAASHPELTGPIVLSGAPMAYWSGAIGQDPLRYGGGLGGGALPALALSDLGGGLFDGAHLVENFERLNPGRTRFRKYVDLYTNIDTAEQRFLDFERWWGGLHLMNGDEMRWIVENLFVGNRLSSGKAELEPGRPIDLRDIRAPIVVFASRGDNITPPPQALNWIVDAYADESEIEVRGQRIVYTVHEEVGHLGIFVSASVATREHTEIASILDTIEALPPGLYELGIEDVVGEGQDKRFRVSFARRTLADVRAFDDERLDEHAFAAVARASEALTEFYESTARPLVQAAVTPTAAAAGRALHPMRLRRSALSSLNPFMAWIPGAAGAVRTERQAIDENNPFRLAELVWADWFEAGFDRLRDAREMATETTFLALWANPFSVWYGAPRGVERKPVASGDLRELPAVRVALERIESGGYAEALVRMLVLIAATRAGGVRRSRLERAFSLLTTREPFASMDASARARLIHEQSLIARFAPEQAFATLPRLLDGERERARALGQVDWVVGDEREMEESTRQRLQELHTLLEPAR